MPVLQFTFSNQLNVSIQVGDTAYYVPTSTSSQFQINSSDIVEMGEVTYVDPGGLEFWCSTTLPSSMYPSGSDYIFFTKDNKINQSNTLGYYAKVKLKNNSRKNAEIYSVAADCFESSK
jgi:hypothetical protein